MLNPTLLSGKNREQADLAVTQLGFTPKEKDHGFNESMQAAIKKREPVKSQRQAKPNTQSVKRDLHHKEPFDANASNRPDANLASRSKRANSAASHRSNGAEHAQEAARDAREMNARAAAKHHATKHAGNEPDKLTDQAGDEAASSCKPDSAPTEKDTSQGAENHHLSGRKVAQEAKGDAPDSKGQNPGALDPQQQNTQPQDLEDKAPESEWALTQAMALMPDAMQNQDEILIQNLSMPASEQPLLNLAVDGEVTLDGQQASSEVVGSTHETWVAAPLEANDVDLVAAMATGNASPKQAKGDKGENGDKTNQALNSPILNTEGDLHAEGESALLTSAATQGRSPILSDAKAQQPGQLKGDPSEKVLQGLTPSTPNFLQDRAGKSDLELPATDSSANAPLANPAAPGMAGAKASLASATSFTHLNQAAPSSLPHTQVGELPQALADTKTFSSHPEALRLIDGEAEDEEGVRFEGEFVGFEIDAEAQSEENLGRPMANGKGEAFASLNVGSQQPGGQSMQDGQMHQQGQQGPWASSALGQAKWQGAGSESGSANFGNFADSTGSSASTAQARLQDIQAMLKRELDAKANSLWQVGSETIEMQLTPEHLGKVKVALELKEGSVTAHIQVQSEAAKQAVDQGMQQLRDNLGQHGFRIENLSVSVEDRHAGLFNPDGRSSNPFHRPTKGGDGNGLDDDQGEAAPAMRYLGYNTLEITA